MTKMKVTVKNLRGVKGRIRKLAPQVRQAVDPVIQRGVRRIHNKIIRLVSTGARTGEERPKGGRSSAPGEPPKTDTGNLVSHTLMDIERTKDSVSGTVSTNTPYAIPLERGTSKMAARPYYQPAIEAETPRIKRELIAALLKHRRKPNE